MEGQSGGEYHMKFVPCQGVNRDHIEKCIHQERGDLCFNGPLYGEIHFMWATTWDPKFKALLDSYRAAWDAKDQDALAKTAQDMIKAWKNRRHKAPNGWLWIIPFPKNTHGGKK